MKKVRAKFVVEEVATTRYNALRVKLAAATADDIPKEERYHEYTPSGSIEMQITNQSAADLFKLGKVLCVDFTIDHE